MWSDLMELNATKEYSDIIKVLESLDEKIDTEIEKFREDFTQKYSLEITRDILQYATDFLKMKFHLPKQRISFLEKTKIWKF